MKRCVRGSGVALRSASITAASRPRGVSSGKRHAWSAAWIHTRERRNVRQSLDVADTFASSGRPVRNGSSLLNSKPRRGELSRTCHSLPPELRLRPGNESRTNRARIADSFLSEFVHGDIWWHRPCAPQNRVKCRQTAATHDRHRSPVVAPAAKNRGLGASGHGRASRIIASSPSPCSVAAST